jgi:nitric oxide reductase subunit B
LFGAVVLVVVGSLVSEALSIHGVSWGKGPLFAQ